MLAELINLRRLNSLYDEVTTERIMEHTLEALPYAYDAFVPVISERTMRTHHDRHHGACVSRLNDLIRSTRFEYTDLASLVIQAKSASRDPALFNSAAQVWNHGFYWHSLSPYSGGQPIGPVARRIVQCFGSYTSFRTELNRHAAGHFGNGWLWLLVNTQGDLVVATTHDADTPLLWGGYPLLCCDLWEHAYYLDFQHDRTQYVSALTDRFLNWNYANARLEAVQGRQVA